MYTTEQDDSGLWLIVDPDEIVICTVTTSRGAEALLSHLNRG